MALTVPTGEVAAARPSRAKGDPQRSGGVAHLSAGRSVWTTATGDTVDATRSRRSSWRPGWDREERLVGSVDRSAYVDGGRSIGWHHRQASEELAVQVEVLRQAAYIQRAGAAVGERVSVRQAGIAPDGTPNRYTVRFYDDNPAAHVRGLAAFADLAVVDAARLAGRIAACSTSWRHQLCLAAGALQVVPSPLRCGLKLWCPHCAQAEAHRRSCAVRARLLQGIDAGEVGSAVLVSLTQRSDPSESATGARQRLRMAYGWWGPGKRCSRSMRAWWTRCVWGTYWSEEVTAGSTGDRYHWHRHVVVVLRPGVSEADAARRLGQRWEAATERAALEFGRAGYGWDPYAGGVLVETGVWNQGGWWAPIDIGDRELRRVGQATKYLVKPGSLDAYRWLQVATLCRGRHRGASGELLGLVTEFETETEEVEETEGPPMPPVGEPVVRSLWSCPVVDADGGLSVSWAVPDELVPAVRSAVAVEASRGVEGPERQGPMPVLIEQVDSWYLLAPRSWARLRGAQFSAQVSTCRVWSCARTLGLACEAESLPSLVARARQALDWALAREDVHKTSAQALAVDWCADHWRPFVPSADDIPY